MGSLYLVEAANWFRSVGLTVIECDGWQTRARSSGGYDSYPLCVMWHHTASQTSPENDTNYMNHGADTRPVANVLIARDGSVWVCAAGATNTNGTGNSQWFSRGTVPADSMNTRAWGMEIANNGVGEIYPQVQIDAAFVASNIINARCGNRADDVCTHEHYSPGRKIDPAGPCAGRWDPRKINSNQTWNVNDLRAECNRRANIKPPPGDTDMALVLVVEDANAPGAMYRCDGVSKTWIADGDMSAQVWMRINESAGGTRPAADGFTYKYMKNGNLDFIRSCGPIVGPIPPGHDIYGRH